MEFAHLEISDTLPHADPMILVDRIEDCDENSIQTSITIHEDTPFLYGAEVPSYVGIEYMAQSIASFSGIKALNEGQQVREGYLVSARKLTLNTSGFKIGDVLNVMASVVFDAGDMAAFDCQINQGDQTLAKARLNVYQPLQPQGIDGHELGQGSL